MEALSSRKLKVFYESNGIVKCIAVRNYHELVMVADRVNADKIIRLETVKPFKAVR